MLKTVGYGVSTLSVILLAIPSWKAASEQPVLFGALVAGMAASITGMFLRWLAYRREQAQKRTAQPASGAASVVLDCPSSRGEQHALDESVDGRSRVAGAGGRRRAGAA
jgi:hypothetical protein